MRFQYFAFLFLCLISQLVYSIDQMTASHIYNKSQDYANKGKFIEAYHEIGWLLGGEYSVLAEKIIRSNSRVADAALSKLNQEYIAELKESDGVVLSFSKMCRLLGVVKGYSSIDKFNSAKALVESSYVDEFEGQSASEVCNKQVDEYGMAAWSVKENKHSSGVAISAIKGYSKAEFCERYGKIIRGDVEEVFSNIYKGVANVERAFRAEAQRRRLFLNRNSVINGGVEIGDSECHVYAARGFPSATNTTEGVWGVHKQFVYRSKHGNFTRYIYVENGKISAIQY